MGRPRTPAYRSWKKGHKRGVKQGIEKGILAGIERGREFGEFEAKAEASRARKKSSGTSVPAILTIGGRRLVSVAALARELVVTPDDARLFLASWGVQLVAVPRPITSTCLPADNEYFDLSLLETALYSILTRGKRFDGLRRFQRSAIIREMKGLEVYQDGLQKGLIQRRLQELSGVITSATLKRGFAWRSALQRAIGAGTGKKPGPPRKRGKSGKCDRCGRPRKRGRPPASGGCRECEPRRR